MITNDEARELLYSWHGGQGSPFYAAASSGLVKDLDALYAETCCMHSTEFPEDQKNLREWLGQIVGNALFPIVEIRGVEYHKLPWCKV